MSKGAKDQGIVDTESWALARGNEIFLPQCSGIELFYLYVHEAGHIIGDILSFKDDIFS
jgi:hypothetical protein